MDGEQRQELDETLNGLDQRVSRERRIEWVRSLGGGEVIEAKRQVEDKSRP